MPRAICKYTIKKNIDAPFACVYRKNQPMLTSRIICSNDKKANAVLGV